MAGCGNKEIRAYAANGAEKGSRTFNIFQVYQYFTIYPFGIFYSSYRWYFFFIPIGTFPKNI
jgi:hypothetical protein